jgi:TolA-binding protein
LIGLLQVIYEDGKFYNQTSLTEIRNKLLINNNQMNLINKLLSFFNINTKETPQSLQEASNKALEIFSNTVKVLIDINIEINNQSLEKEEQIKQMENEVKQLNQQVDKNIRIITKVNDILD